MLFGPYLGEFGWEIIDHVRHVHKIQSVSKVVCCQKGEELLFPSATLCFTDWKHPVPDNQRCGSNGNWQSYMELSDQIKARFPNEPIDPLNYDCKWHMSDSVKFKIQVTHELPQVDIALGVRKRVFGANANWPYWESVGRKLMKLGFSVGLIGAKETSYDFDCETKAWSHSQGTTAGSVDILNHCKLYVGTDTGVTHLACLIDAPTMVFYCPAPGRPDLTGLMARANKNKFKRLDNFAWENPEYVLGSILMGLE